MTLPAYMIADLGCGAGGASWGYHLAGRLDVTGVDNVPQPRYPVKAKFALSDAMEFLERHGRKFHAFALSPPCQYYSDMSDCRPGLAETYPDLIPSWREAVQSFGVPYVIENVRGAPLKNPLMLCSARFGREMYRHRFFESDFELTGPAHQKHTVRASKAGHWEPGTYISVAGHCAPIEKARQVMGIQWMVRDELVEAVPPYFTEHIGHQLVAELDRRHA